MELLQKVSGRAKGITGRAREIRDKSSNIIEIAKLKHEISKLEKEKENNFAGLGLLFYQQYQGVEGSEEEINRLLEVTKDLELEIKALEAKIANLQPKNPVCPGCNEELPSGGIYCSFCGLRVVEG